MNNADRHIVFESNAETVKLEIDGWPDEQEFMELRQHIYGKIVKKGDVIQPPFSDTLNVLDTEPDGKVLIKDTKTQIYWAPK